MSAGGSPPTMSTSTSGTCSRTSGIDLGHEPAEPVPVGVDVGRADEGQSRPDVVGSPAA